MLSFPYQLITRWASLEFCFFLRRALRSSFFRCSLTLVFSIVVFSLSWAPVEPLCVPVSPSMKSASISCELEFHVLLAKLPALLSPAFFLANHFSWGTGSLVHSSHHHPCLVTLRLLLSATAHVLEMCTCCFTTRSCLVFNSVVSSYLFLVWGSQQIESIGQKRKHASVLVDVAGESDNSTLRGVEMHLGLRGNKRVDCRLTNVCVSLQTTT